jgi:hypothetical protein
MDLGGSTVARWIRDTVKASDHGVFPVGAVPELAPMLKRVVVDPVPGTSGVVATCGGGDFFTVVLENGDILSRSERPADESRQRRCEGDFDAVRDVGRGEDALPPGS